MGENLGSLILRERHSRHRDRAPTDLNSDIRVLKDVAVPGGIGPPPRRDDITAVSGVMLDNFEDRLTWLTRHPPNVIQQ